MSDAKLRGAAFTDAKFDTTITLPDGKKWQPDTDMRQYTENYSGADLRGEDLTDIRLIGAHFNHADLSGIGLRCTEVGYGRAGPSATRSCKKGRRSANALCARWKHHLRQEVYD